MYGGFMQLSPMVLIVTYQSGRTECHRYSSYSEAQRAQEKFSRFPTVTQTQIKDARLA